MNRTVLCGVTAACVVLLLEQAGQGQVGQAARGVRLEIQSGSKAEYRVREQLARLNVPDDAVGATESIAGVIVMRPGHRTKDGPRTKDGQGTKAQAPRTSWV